MTTTTGYRWRLAGLSLAMLLPSLGTSIANVALPAIVSSLGATMPGVQWIVIAYLLSITTLIVGAGRLGDLFGRRQMLLAGIAIFTAASLACALSPTLWMLIAARALQGAGAALMMSLTIAAVADTLPKEQTGRAMGLLGTVSAVGTALGPTLGGVLIAWSGWPAIFAFVTLVGMAAILLGWRVFQRAARPAPDPATRFDAPGFLLLGVALGAYSVSMTLPAMVVPLVAVAAAALAVFVRVELRSPSPLLAVRELRDRNLSSALVALCLVTTIVMATLVVGPFYLTGTAGLSATQAGLVMSTGPVVSASVGLPAGSLIDRWGARGAALTGLVLAVAGCVLMVVLPRLLGVPGYVAALAPITGGYALFQAANNTAVMTSAPPDQRGVYSALLGLSRNLGLITGASAMGAIFAIASTGLPVTGPPGGGLMALEVTFAVAALLASVATVLTLAGRKDGKP